MSAEACVGLAVRSGAHPDPLEPAAEACVGLAGDGQTLHSRAWAGSGSGMTRDQPVRLACGDPL